MDYHTLTSFAVTKTHFSIMYMCKLIKLHCISGFCLEKLVPFYIQLVPFYIQLASDDYFKKVIVHN